MLKYAILLIVPTMIVAPDRFKEQAKQMFKNVDTDMDGKVTTQEIHKNFEAYDADRDGIVSRHEFVSHFDVTIDNMHYMAHALFDLYDANGDHRLELHDFDVLKQLIDSNSDGEVTEDEWVRFWSILLADLDHLRPDDV